MALTLKNYPVVEQLKKNLFSFCACFCVGIGAQLNSIDGLPIHKKTLCQPALCHPVNFVIKKAPHQTISPKTEFQHKNFQYYKGAIIRGDSSIKEIALIFTGDEFAEGGAYIKKVLRRQKIKASFFLTGNFYRNEAFAGLIKSLNDDGHYLGPHSDKHLLYCDWKKRDSLLVSNEEFRQDLFANLGEIKKLSIHTTQQFFLPPYEWYNEHIARWTKESGLQLINFTPGTLSHADYTYPGAGNYRSSDEIFQSIMKRERESINGLNGFLLLMHVGTDEKRIDKFYYKLDELLKTLKQKGYGFKRVDGLLR